MDKLWEGHITWTRMVIVDFAAGLLDLKTAEARLLRNQADIGNAIRLLRTRGRQPAHPTAAHSHSRSSPGARSVESRRQEEADAGAQRLVCECAPDRRLPQRRQSTELAARDDEVDDEAAPGAHHEGSGSHA
jgi:hypothetical protein